MSHVILTRNGFDESVSVIASGHHGTPPDKKLVNNINKSYGYVCGFEDESWLQAQNKLLALGYQIADLTPEQMKFVRLSREAQALLSGLVVLTDWIVSDTMKFPLLPINIYDADSMDRAHTGFQALDLPGKWKPEQNTDDLYLKRFELFNINKPRPIQEELLRLARSVRKPGIFVIEAPMGEGKTEASLVAAEVLAERIGCRGIYYALPTQATSDAMFERVIRWIKTFDDLNEQYSVNLIHGKSDLNETFNSIKELSRNILSYDEADEAQNAVVHQWFKGRKKGILSDFAVGTIDHVLMAGLKQKHLVLRHLGLASKVVIIDECHAYDVYMGSYLEIALNWLGAYGVPVIVLSATLPDARRYEVINAYLNKKVKNSGYNKIWAKSFAYPRITYNDGEQVYTSEDFGTESKSREWDVNIQTIDDDRVLDILAESLSDGGYAGIIVNTIERAQKLYLLASERFGASTVLLHAGFLARDRKERERNLVNKLGNTVNTNDTRWSERMVVVGTQVFEQSMDIDFDMLITDLCPIDLLLQRIGRLHRHIRKRPDKLSEPVCYVLGAKWKLEAGSVYVYGAYLLMRSLAILPDKIRIPNDIPRLVSLGYDNDIEIDVPIEVREDYARASLEWGGRQSISKSHAMSYQVNSPLYKASLMGWIDSAPSEGYGEATVREGTDAIEVLVIQRKNEKLRLLPWVNDGKVIPKGVPDEDLTRLIAECSLRLPARICRGIKMCELIKCLESDMRTHGIAADWQKTELLRGALCLILNEKLEASLCGTKLRYDRDIGLSIL